MPLVLLLPLIAQIGPGGALPQAPLPAAKPKAAPVSQANLPDPLKQCLELAMARPADAIEVAQNWLAAAKTMKERAGARQCQAMALTRIDGLAEAAVLFLAAREDTPANEGAERARLAALGGNAHLAAGDPATALAALDLARSDARDGADSALKGLIDNNEAIHSFNQGRLPEAAASLASALEIDPERPELLANLGHVQAASGDMKASEESFKKALMKDPFLEPALSGLGLLYVRTGRPRDTLDILARFIEDPAPSSRIALACSRAMVSMERHAEAIALLQRAAAADPGNPDLQAELASYKVGN